MQWQSSLATLNPNINCLELLQDNGSLSANLRKQGHLELKLLSQQLCAATLEEQQLLSIVETTSYIREVQMLISGAPLVSARVIIPYATYLHFQSILDNLGNNSIGDALLFKQPFQRSQFEYAKFKNTILRRSIFSMLNFKALVIERFVNS